MIATTVPVTIEADAQQRINQLGRQKEVEEMLEHAMQSIPGLVRIEVAYADYEGTGIEPVVFDAVVKQNATNELIAIDHEWNSWRYSVYPPEIAMQFILSAIPEFDDAA